MMRSFLALLRLSGFAGLVLGIATGAAAMTSIGYLEAQRSTTKPIGKAQPRQSLDCDQVLSGAKTSSAAVSSVATLPGRSAPVVPAVRLRVDAFDQAGAARLDHLPGEVLVKFRPDASASARTRALNALRSRPLVSDLQWEGPVGRYVDPAGGDARAMAEALARQPEVEFAQPNYIRRVPRELGRGAARSLAGARATPMRVPSDPDYQDLQWNMRLIDAPGAWAINPGGNPDVIVAVLDTGITTSPVVMTRSMWRGQRFESVTLPFAVSPDLAAARFVGARDFAFEPGGPVVDFDGHGTHVASTIAEEANNALAVAGLAYNVRLMPLKVCVGYWELLLRRAALGVEGWPDADAGGCADADIAAAIRYAADNGARVINLSLGGPGASPVQRDALAYAVSKGVFVSTAVGNAAEEGNPVEYPAGYAPGIDGVMSVGAVGKSGTRAFYSSTGPHLEVMAPGGNSFDGAGDVDRGYVWQVTLYPPDVDPALVPIPRFDRYLEVGYAGTSMATAHVSALAALLASQGILSPRGIEAAILRSAQDLGSAGRDNLHGYGLIRARAALVGLGLTR